MVFWYRISSIKQYYYIIWISNSIYSCIIASMFQWIRNIWRKRLRTLNTITVHKSHILHNLWYLQGLHPHADIFPVIKSNAYGHGIKEVLRALKRVNLPYIVVDSIPEYQIIRKYSQHPVLMIGETLQQNYQWLDLRTVTPCVSNYQTLETILKLKKKCKIHIFLNTGMNREWCKLDELTAMLDLLDNHRYGHRVYIEGVLSHFSDADEQEETIIQKQIDIFKECYHYIVDRGHLPVYKHIGNSAACLEIQDKFFTAWRPGKALYGNTADLIGDYALKPALTLQSSIIAIQKLQKGDSVGYGSTRTAEKDCTVISIPFGYQEGMRRDMSGKIFAHYQNKNIQQVWRISMNLSTFLLPEGMKASLGDRVTLRSTDNEHCNPFARAQASQTITSEILTGLDSNIRRKLQ